MRSRLGLRSSSFLRLVSWFDLFAGEHTLFPWCMLENEQPMSTAKQDIELLLNRLPDDCSIEDIQYHLYVLDKVRRGLEDANLNGTLSQQDVENHLSKWL